MKIKSIAKVQRNRRSQLAQALALALGIGAAAVMAQPQARAYVDLAQAETMYLNHFGTLDGFDAYMTRLLPQKRADDVQAVTATRYVSNCNDSGSGSFRSIMAAANSGDTIDLSGCSGTINLVSSVVTGLNDLTIRGGDDGASGVKTILHGGDAIRPLAHTGTGTLTLENLAIRNGRLTNGVARGGCISSFGDVSLTDSIVKYCEVSQTSGVNEVRGGGIYSAGKVTLSNSSVQKSKASTSIAGRAVMGGGIYANSIEAWNSSIFGNKAISLSGVVKGGGVYVGDGDSILWDSVVTENGVSAANADVHTYGGGIFAKRTSLSIVHSSITKNTATKYGEGGGVFVSAIGPSDTLVKYSNVNENEAVIGGGINSRSGLTLTSSTVAKNKATAHGGLIVTGGNISISRSTISQNTAEQVAGATLKALAGGTIIVQQSTISKNRTTLDPTTVTECPGTGLRVESNATINNSTIVFNVNDQGTTSSEFCGGLGLRLGAGVTATASSSVIAHNWAEYTQGGTLKRASGQNVYGPSPAKLMGNFNAIGNSSFALPADTIAILSDELVANYQVSPVLADNGGPTLTHWPYVLRWLIDSGTANGYTTDQRGYGFERVKGSQADIGAVESDPVGPPIMQIFKDGFE